MNVLVAYASKYGATEAIAERIAEQLRASGLQADARPAKSAGDPSGYDAYVIGGAAYFGGWHKEAVEFARHNRVVLAGHPTWLFSSGPLGTAPTDAKGQDLRVAAEPKEFPEFEEAIHPRGRRVFFGTLDPGKLGFRDRAVRTMPAGRALLPEGDFRDWPDIDAWARGIAHELAPELVPAPGG